MHTKKLLAACSIVILAGILAGCGLPGLPAPELVEPSDGTGVWGPLVIQFSEALSPAGLTELVSMQPQAAGKWLVNETQLLFWPDEPLTPGSYQVQIGAGLRSLEGRRLLRAVYIDVTVRQPRVAYLGRVGSEPELWLAEADGSAGYQLTHTEGQVMDYAVSADGNTFAIVRRNTQGGADLYLLRRADWQLELLLACGSDECCQPAFLAGEQGLIYSRQASSGLPILHIVTLAVEDTDTGWTGILPNPSPNGKSVAYYDPSAQGIQVKEPGSPEPWLLPSPVEGSGAWSRDGGSLFYPGAVGPGASPYSAACQADVASRQVQPILSLEWLDVEYGQPVPSPDGNEILASERPAGSFISKQLKIFTLQGDEVQAVTGDVLYTHGAYSWSFDASSILYQRYAVGGTDSQPEVLVWKRSDGRLIRLAQDAAMPRWVP